jgi:hypothetical protein
MNISFNFNNEACAFRFILWAVPRKGWPKD